MIKWEKAIIGIRTCDCCGKEEKLDFFDKKWDTSPWIIIYLANGERTRKDFCSLECLGNWIKEQRS